VENFTLDCRGLGSSFDPQKRFVPLDAKERESGFYLSLNHDGQKNLLQLCWSSEKKKLQTLSLHFAKDWARWSREQWSSSDDPFWRSLGIAVHPYSSVDDLINPPLIIDATAGLGGDALRLLYYG
jgi:hypothetical protein